MNFEEFKGLDPEEVAAQCGGTTLADSGPNPGTAGEQEATVADIYEEHGGEELDSETGAEPTDTDSSGDDVGYRKVKLRVSALVDRLQTAAPHLSEEACLDLLCELSADTSRPQAKLMLGQFVPAELEERVDAWIVNHSHEVVVDDDATDDNPSDQSGFEESDSAAIDKDRDSDSDWADESEDLSVDELVNRAKRELLSLANQAYELGQSDKSHEMRALVRQIADVLWGHAFMVYRAAGWDDDRIKQQLCKGPDGAFITDAAKKRYMWYQRTAFALTHQEHRTPAQFLRDFSFPGLTARRRVHRDENDGVVPQAPPRHFRVDPDDSAEADCDKLADDLPVGDEELDTSSDESTAEELEITPDSIVVSEVDGHRVVSYGELPDRKSHIVSGGGPKLKPSSKSTLESDESFLVELPDEVFEAAVKAVIEDPDLEQCWAFRSADAVRAEAERRILVEYGRQSVA